MMDIRLKEKAVADLHVDAIVTENSPCGISFETNAAGRTVIRVKPPKWMGGKQKEAAKLSRRYVKVLEQADKRGLRSIGFPLISVASGGFPPDKALKAAFRACVEWTIIDPKCDMEIVFGIPDSALLDMARQELDRQLKLGEKRKQQDEKARATLKDLATVLHSSDVLFGGGDDSSSGSDPSGQTDDGPESILNDFDRATEQYARDPLCCPETEKALQLIHILQTDSNALIGTALMRDLYDDRKLFVSTKPLAKLKGIPVFRSSHGLMGNAEEGVHFYFRYRKTASEGKCMLACTSRRKIHSAPDTVYMLIPLEQLLEVVCDPEREYDGLIFNLDTEGYFVSRQSLQNLLNLFREKYRKP